MFRKSVCRFYHGLLGYLELELSFLALRVLRIELFAI